MRTRQRYLYRARARVLRSRAGQAVLVISGATVLAQVIAMAAVPILTRLYSPKEYGAFFIVNSLSLALAAGLAMRLELAIPLPLDDGDARNLVTLATAAIALMLLGVTTVSLIWRGVMASTLALPGSPWIILLVAPLAASFALFAVLNAVAVRERRFGAIARRQLVVAVLTVALQLVAGLVDGSVSGLAIATLVAQLMGVVSLYVGSPLMARRFATTRAQLLRILRRYSNFPLLLAPAGWLNSLGSNAPLLVVGALYATNAAGWFGLTLRIVALPATLVGTAIAQVYLSELARRRREQAGTERALFLKTSAILSVPAVLFGGALLLVGPWAFDIAFGPEWAPAGDMARAYALAASAQILASPVSATLIVYERVVIQIVWDASRLLLTVGSLIVAWRLHASVVTAVWALSVATALCYAANWEVCRRTVMRRQKPEGVFTSV
jgi:O-antigen/teichoic acid export membrane protein